MGVRFIARITGKALCLALFTMPVSVWAYECQSYMSVDLWGANNAHLAGIDAAMSRCLGDYGVVRGGVSYFANDEFLYQGLTTSLRARAGQDLSAYIGVGMLVGEAEKDVDASNDGINNDGDAYVDETDETRTIYDANMFVYPEVGLEIFLGDVGLVVSAKKYYGYKFDGEVIYNVGFATRLP